MHARMHAYPCMRTPTDQLTPRSFVARSGAYIPENRILQRHQDSHDWSYVFKYKDDIYRLKDEEKKKKLKGKLAKLSDDVILKAREQVRGLL